MCWVVGDALGKRLQVVLETGHLLLEIVGPGFCLDVERRLALVTTEAADQVSGAAVVQGEDGQEGAVPLQIDARPLEAGVAPDAGVELTTLMWRREDDPKARPWVLPLEPPRGAAQVHRLYSTTILLQTTVNEAKENTLA